MNLEMCLYLEVLLRRQVLRQGLPQASQQSLCFKLWRRTSFFNVSSFVDAVPLHTLAPDWKSPCKLLNRPTPNIDEPKREPGMELALIGASWQHSSNSVFTEHV